MVTLKRTHVIGAALGFLLLCVLGGSYFWYQGEKQKRSAEMERVKIEAEAQIQAERKRTEETKQAVTNAELKAANLPAAKETSRVKPEKEKSASETLVRQRAPQQSAQKTVLPLPAAQPTLQPVTAQPAVQPVVQPPVVQARASPQEFCEGKPNFISKGICDMRECEKPQYFDSGYCKAYRELSARSRRIEN